MGAEGAPRVAKKCLYLVPGVTLELPSVAAVLLVAAETVAGERAAPD